MVLISLLGGLINLVSNYLFVHVGLQALLKLRTDPTARSRRCR